VSSHSFFTRASVCRSRVSGRLESGGTNGVEIGQHPGGLKTVADRAQNLRRRREIFLARPLAGHGEHHGPLGRLIDQPRLKQRDISLNLQTQRIVGQFQLVPWTHSRHEGDAGQCL
jgi:hypothetical protein